MPLYVDISKLDVGELDSFGSLAVFYGVVSIEEVICCCLDDCLAALETKDAEEGAKQLEHNPEE